MKQIKFITAIIIPLCLIGCTDAREMFDEGNTYRSTYSNVEHPSRIPVSASSASAATSTTANNTNTTPSKHSSAASRTEAAAEQGIVVVPPADKTAGPTVPLEAPSVSGS